MDSAMTKMGILGEQQANIEKAFACLKDFTNKSLEKINSDISEFKKDMLNKFDGHHKHLANMQESVDDLEAARKRHQNELNGLNDLNTKRKTEINKLAVNFHKLDGDSTKQLEFKAFVDSFSDQLRVLQTQSLAVQNEMS